MSRDIAPPTLRDVWAESVAKWPGKTALTCEGRSLTYAECDSLTDRLAGALAARFGFAKGDLLAVAAPNCAEYVIAFWAAMKLGGIVVPVNTRLGRAEIEHILAHSGANVLLLHQANRRALEEALPAARNITRVIGIGFDAEDGASWGTLVAGGPPLRNRPQVACNDPAIIMHTSGTTGRPKGAVMRHCDLHVNNQLAILAHELSHDDIHLLILPMFHATSLYSLVPTAAHQGATIVLAPRPDIAAAAELIQAHRCTTFFGVPTIFRMLTTLKQLARYDLSSLRLVAYAGSPMAPGVIRRLRELLPRAKLHNFFGLTETISMTHLLPDADADARPESVGKPLPGIRQRILDPEGNDVAPGETGELHFHRDNVISDYWREPGRLRKSFRGEWYNTGDLAAADADGYITLKGRSKEMIIVGGENVYALEIETCIQELDAVLEAAVIGVPATGFRSYLGELVKAVVVPRPGADVTERDIKRHCMQRLAGYKVPQLIEFRDALPRNSAGKILKRILT